MADAPKPAPTNQPSPGTTATSAAQPAKPAADAPAATAEQPTTGRWKVSASNPKFSGQRHGLMFKDGVAYTDDQLKARLLKHNSKAENVTVEDTKPPKPAEPFELPAAK